MTAAAGTLEPGIKNVLQGGYVDFVGLFWYAQ